MKECRFPCAHTRARGHAGACRIKMPLLSQDAGARQHRGELGTEKETETKMMLNSFIIQMNGNHADASRRGRASVSKLASQLREGANEAGQLAASWKAFDSI